MAGRIRSIKPEILEDHEAAGLSDGAWRLWISLWALCDDHGNSRSTAKWLASQVWWVHGRDPVEVEQLVAELVDGRRVELYLVRGERYLHIRNWEKHQRIDNAGKPRVPLLSEGTPVCATLRGEPPRISANLGDSPLDQRPRPTTTEEDQRPITQSPPAPAFDFDSVYALYPRKEGKTRGVRTWKRAVTTQAQYERWCSAVRNYAAHVAGRATEHIKQFDSFMSCWTEYVDFKPSPQGDLLKPRTGNTAPSANFAEAGDKTAEYT